MKGGNVQLSRNFFDAVEILTDCLNESGYNEIAQALCNILREEIKKKREAMARRDAFSAYKTAEHGTKEREKWRNEYLYRAGITRKFRSQNEIIESPPSCAD